MYGKNKPKLTPDVLIYKPSIIVTKFWYHSGLIRKNHEIDSLKCILVYSPIFVHSHGFLGHNNNGYILEFSL